MPESQFRARQVGAKTQEVVEYDHDDSLRGKPLHILIPGGLVALGSLAVILLVAYMTWVDGRLSQTTGLLLIGLLAPFYIGGVFLFSYGYELYNVPRAIRLTAIIVFVTVGAVVIKRDHLAGFEAVVETHLNKFTVSATQVIIDFISVG